MEEGCLSFRVCRTIGCPGIAFGLLAQDWQQLLRATVEKEAQKRKPDRVPRKKKMIDYCIPCNQD